MKFSHSSSTVVQNQAVRLLFGSRSEIFSLSERDSAKCRGVGWLVSLSFSNAKIDFSSSILGKSLSCASASFINSRFG